MPKMKVDEIDLDAWDAQEVDDREADFEPYKGEIPPTGTMLLFRVTKMWMTYTAEKADGGGDEPMLKVLCVAEENPGELSEYDGLPCWENLGLFASMKWKTLPFLDFWDLDIRDFKGPKASMTEADDDDNIGIPIQKVKKFTPGSDDAVFVGVTDSEKFQGKWQAHIKSWLDADTELEEEEEEEERPARRTRRSSANGARKPTRGTRSRNSRAKDEEPEESEEEEEERPRGRSRATRAKSTKAAPARGRRTRSSDGDEPPF